MSSDAEWDVLNERHRQKKVELFSDEHDDAYKNNELVDAAVCYALSGTNKYSSCSISWPWDMMWWKPTSRRRNLVKAAALLIAEIERIDRKEGRK